MSQKTKLKSRVPGFPSKPPRIRMLGLETLFFVALAVFGFSLVKSLAGPSGEPLIVFEPLRIVPQPVQAGGPYEAVSRRPAPQPDLSPIFMPSVQYWKDDILAWAQEYEVDPNLVATVMQIESCGNPDARSRSGAMGLFQVMPFHFESGEKPYEPDTNAYRGLSYLRSSLDKSDGHAGLALAGYNGGHSLIYRDYEMWPYESQRYYRWGTGIYREASAGWDSSPTLAAWLSAGGQSLCDQAETALDLTTTGSSSAPPSSP